MWVDVYLSSTISIELHGQVNDTLLNTGLTLISYAEGWMDEKKEGEKGQNIF